MMHAGIDRRGCISVHGHHPIHCPAAVNLEAAAVGEPQMTHTILQYCLYWCTIAIYACSRTEPQYIGPGTV